MTDSWRATNVLIMGAAGRDFHNFNVVYRDDPSFELVAFTAAQIPGIERRRYPSALAGPHYPQGIAIVPESELESLIARERIDQVVFAYSDLSHAEVMHRASRASWTGFLRNSSRGDSGLTQHGHRPGALQERKLRLVAHE